MTDPTQPTSPYLPVPAIQPLIIGDFVVSPHQFQYPRGTAPMAGTHWTIDISGASSQRTPTILVVLAVVLIPCTAFLSLLLLLIKSDIVYGTVVIGVASAGGVMTTRVQVDGDDQLHWYRNAVEQAQAWSFSGRRA